MHKGLQWAIAAMIFIIMIAVAGPHLARWYEQFRDEQALKREQSLEETRKAIETLTAKPEELPEPSKRDIYEDCAQTGAPHSEACQKYLTYLREHDMPIPDFFR